MTKKKILVLALSLAMVAILAVGGSLAYFTDTKNADNTFTVGNVKIELIEQQREGRTFVMVSHDLQKGFAMCTHAMVLAKGKVVAFDQKDALDFDEFSGLYRQTVGMGVA